MRDDVVQLARDPRPLLGDRQLRRALALVLELGGELRRRSVCARWWRTTRPASAGSTTAVTAPMYSPGTSWLSQEPRTESADAERRERHDGAQVRDVRSERVEEDERGDVADDDVAVGGDEPRQRPDHRGGRRVGAAASAIGSVETSAIATPTGRGASGHTSTCTTDGHGEREGEQEIGATEADDAEIIRTGGARHQPVG